MTRESSLFKCYIVSCEGTPVRAQPIATRRHALPELMAASKQDFVQGMWQTAPRRLWSRCTARQSLRFGQLLIDEGKRFINEMCRKVFLGDFDVNEVFPH